MEKNCARMDSEGIEIPPVICSLTQVGPYRFNIPPLFQTKFILFCAGACPGLQRWFYFLRQSHVCNSDWWKESRKAWFTIFAHVQAHTWKNVSIFFSERIVNIWNALDDDLVCSSSLNVFKMDFIYYGRRTDCRWVSYSLLTYDPQRLSRVPLVRPQPGE